MGCRYPVLVVAIDRSIGQVFTEVYILESSTSPAYISAQATTYFWPTRLPQAHLPSTSPQYFQSVLRGRNGIRAPLRPITPTHLSSSSSVDTSWCESPGKCWRVIHPISVMWTYLPSVTATTPLCIADGKYVHITEIGWITRQHLPGDSHQQVLASNPSDFGNVDVFTIGYR